VRDWKTFAKTWAGKQIRRVQSLNTSFPKRHRSKTIVRQETFHCRACLLFDFEYLVFFVVSSGKKPQGAITRLKPHNLHFSSRTHPQEGVGFLEEKCKFCRFSDPDWRNGGTDKEAMRCKAANPTGLGRVRISSHSPIFGETRFSRHTIQSCFSLGELVSPRLRDTPPRTARDSFGLSQWGTTDGFP
jgi:hypothetical protein